MAPPASDAMPEEVEIIPWREIQRMLQDEEPFPEALAKRMWEVSWAKQTPHDDTPVIRVRQPFPYVDYCTGHTVMPDGKTIVDAIESRRYTLGLLKAIRKAICGEDKVDEELGVQIGLPNIRPYAPHERPRRLPKSPKSPKKKKKKAMKADPPVAAEEPEEVDLVPGTYSDC